MFKTPNSGLTFLDRDNHELGAYKTHTHDPIIFQNGMKLVFRNNENTDDCGTIDCCPRYFQPHDVKFSSKLIATTLAAVEDNEEETSQSIRGIQKSRALFLKYFIYKGVKLSWKLDTSLF